MKTYTVEVLATVRFRHEVEARSPAFAASKLRARFKRNPEGVAEGVVPAKYGATVEEFEVYEDDGAGGLRLVRDRLADEK